MQRDEHYGQQANAPLDPPFIEHDRMNKLRDGGGVNMISLRECALPPEDLAVHHHHESAVKKSSSSNKKHSSDRHGKKKKGKKKKSDKEKKSDRERRRKSKKPDRDCYQAIPSEAGEPVSNKEDTPNKKQAQHRAIPESLTGREISWSRSYLEDTEVIPFVDDLHKAPKEVVTAHRRHRRHRRRRSNEEAPAPTQEAKVDAEEEQHKEKEGPKQIILDRDGFPIEEDDSVHSLHVQDFSRPSSGSAAPKQLNDSFASTEQSHAGSRWNDSLTSIENSLMDSHLNLHGSFTSTERSRMESVLQGSAASTERSLLSSNPVEAPGSGGLNEFFKQHRRDEMAAIKTATAFEAFLRQQHEMTSEGNDDDSDNSSSHSWSFKEDLRGSMSEESDDPFLHSRFWGSESTLLPCNDTVKSFQEDSSNHDEFGLVRRNEAFVKRVSSTDLMKSTSEGTLRSSVVDTHSTTRTDSLTLSTLGTKESPPRKSIASGKAILDTRRQKSLAPFVSSRSLDAIIPRERTVTRQLASLSLSQRSCVDALKAKWEKQNEAEKWFTDEMYLRFARCSPGDPYNFKSAWKAMKRFDWRYAKLSMSKLEATVLTKAAFPVPGLKTKKGRNVFYMRPSRYFPRKAPVDNMIDLVVYVMNCMLEKEHSSVHGLVLVANMADWSMDNFSVSYWHKFLMTLQGKRVPTRIGAFFIVDPPTWFDSIWNIMKPMMSDDFQAKVAMLSSDQLGSYLAPGYRNHLPDDVDGGHVNTNALVKAFVAERKAIESAGPWRKL